MAEVILFGGREERVTLCHYFFHAFGWNVRFWLRHLTVSLFLSWIRNKLGYYGETGWVIYVRQEAPVTRVARPLHVIVLTARVADPRRTVDGTFVNRPNLPEIGLPYHHSWAFSCLGTPFRLGQVTQYRGGRKRRGVVR
jgi:hypothetical protein